MPLHPTKYADMLSEKMQHSHVNVWLVNAAGLVVLMVLANV